MNNTASGNTQKTFNQLQRARTLDLPSREAMLHRTPAVQNFWNNNRSLLSDAWVEWEESQQEAVLPLNDSLIDESLRNAVQQAWKNPAKELAVKDLLHEVSQGVFQFQLFDPQRIDNLRHYLRAVSKAGIPLRPPYGIALNRGGAMLDRRSEGYLAAPSFQSLYQELLDTYMRPIARLLFPEIVGFDSQTFGFSIQYQAGVDTSLRLHTDASAATLNINLNLPGEEFTGSEVDFHDSVTGKINRLSFTPGTAMIHLGSVAHAAQPITSGSRSNLVLWLYGEGGQTPLRGIEGEFVDAKDRWSIPLNAYDNVAPF